MKVFILCVALFAAGVVGNSIDDLVKDALEYIRKQMKEHEPTKVPDIPQQVIKDDEAKIYLTADLTDVYVSKASDFTVDHIENNLIDFWAKFGVTVPKAHFEGKFIISGSAMGHDVRGTGTFSADVSGLKVDGFIQNELLDDKYLHIEHMDLDYVVQDLKFKEQGLVVDGMSQEQLEQLFNEKLLAFLHEKEELVCSKVAAYVTAKANEHMKGKTLEQVIDWLRHIIHN